MYKIRRGKDFKVIWSFFDCDGNPYILRKEYLALFVKSSFSTIEITDFIVQENKIIWVFKGKDQKNLGDYSLELFTNNGEDGMIPVDSVDAFTLVQYSKDESSCTCDYLKVEDVSLKSDLDIESMYILANFQEQLDKKADKKDVDTAINTKAEEIYSVTSEALTGLDNSINQKLAAKVDKVSGKQLSTEDFTTALKQKLQGLNNYDDAALTAAIDSLQNQINTLVSGNASSAIDTFNEIVAFLNGVKNTEDLAGIIASIEQQIASVNRSLSSSITDLQNKDKQIDSKLSELSEEVGNLSQGNNKEFKTPIPRDAANDGKWFNFRIKNIGDTINFEYPSSNESLHYEVAECSEGDHIFIHASITHNNVIWAFLDAENKMIAKGEQIQYDVIVQEEIIAPSNAAKVVINSSMDERNYIAKKDSFYIYTEEKFATASEGQNLLNYPIECETLYNMAFDETFLPSLNFAKSDAWKTYILKILPGMEKLKMTFNAGYGYAFLNNDGSYVQGSGQNKTLELDIPTNAKVFYAATKISNGKNPILVTGRRIKLTELQTSQYAREAEHNTLYNICEANSTGRFKFDEVGVADYHNAFKELSYISKDFVFKGELGRSQQPSEDAVDQNTYPILHFRYQKVGATPTRMISLMAAIHGDSEGFTNTGGDSPQNILSLYYFLMDLILHPNKNDKYRWLTDNYIIDVVPIINPWGVQNHSRFNGRGVDLNRNSSHNWEKYTGGHKGSAPFSEAESQIYRDYIESLMAEGKPIDVVIEIHSRGEILLTSDARFMGFGPDNYKDIPWNVSKRMGAKYNAKESGWRVFSSEEEEPTMYAWTNWEKGIPSFNAECCQSMMNDISTRNSKFINVQMADFISELAFWCTNPKGVVE